MSEEIDRWISYMRNNPNKWKKIHTEFINAQYEKSYRVINKLSKDPEGKKKIINAYKIENKKGYPRIL